MRRALGIGSLLLLIGCASEAPVRAKATAPTSPVHEAPPPRPARTIPFGDAEALGRAVDAYMAGFGSQWGPGYAPSGVLVIAQDGAPILTRSYGKVDPARPDAPSLDTVFRIGSLSKQLTAALVLRLVASSELDLRDSVRKHVPELPVAYAPITLHQLLSQTSGVAAYTDDPALLAKRKEPIASSELVAWLAAHELAFTPGARYGYSNSNYFLLSLVVERVTKRPFADALRERLLTPAGLTQTGIAQPGLGAAVGMLRDAEEALVPAGAVDDSMMLGAGAVRSSARDLLRWDQLLESDDVLDSARRGELLRGYADCPEAPGGRYAYGFIAQPITGVDTQWHNGKVDGYASFLLRAPSRGLAVLLLSNNMSFDATGAGLAIARMVLAEQPAAPVVETPRAPIDEAYAKGWVGTFALTRDAKAALAAKLPEPVLRSIERVTLAWDGTKLTLQPVGQGPVRMFRASEAGKERLYNADLALDVIPAPRKPDAPVSALTLLQGGLSIEYGRLRPPHHGKMRR